MANKNRRVKRTGSKPTTSKNIADLVRSQHQNGQGDIQVLDKEPDIETINDDLVDEAKLFEAPEIQDENGDGGDDGPRRATDGQVYAAKLYKTRQQLVNYMNRVSQLESELSQKVMENAKLMNELAVARREVNMIHLGKMDEENSAMFKRVGLSEGDRVTDQVEGRDGWFVVQNK